MPASSRSHVSHNEQGSRRQSVHSWHMHVTAEVLTYLPARIAKTAAMIQRVHRMGMQHLAPCPDIGVFHRKVGESCRNFLRHSSTRPSRPYERGRAREAGNPCN